MVEGGGGNSGGGKGNFGKNLGNTTGLPTPIIVPKTGTMIVFMKDGTKHEFALEQVKSVVRTVN